MRLYRILETDYQTEDGVALPAYTFLVNPDTGERFSNKEDLIRWFCTHAGVSRAWVFNRIKVIRILRWNLKKNRLCIRSKRFQIKKS